MKRFWPLALLLGVFIAAWSWRTFRAERHAPRAGISSKESVLSRNRHDPREAASTTPPRSGALVSGEPDSTLARVGPIVISRPRLERRAQVLEITAGARPEPASLFVEVLEEVVKQQVALQALGIAPGPADLERKLAELRQDPARRELLDRVEKVFQGDRGAFLEEFVRGVETEERLWNTFRSDPVIHERAYALSRQTFEAVQRKAHLFETIAPPGGRFGRYTVPAEPHAPTRSSSLPVLQRLPVEADALGRVPAGGIFPNPIDTPEAVLILKVTKRQKEEAEVEVWKIAKVNYHSWLADRAKEVGLNVLDSGMKDTLKGLDKAHWLSSFGRAP